jgi:hypothetical protein
MKTYKGMLALLALQFAATASAADASTQCGQQADLVELMLTVRADGFPRQGVEAELQKTLRHRTQRLLATSCATTLTEIRL